MTILSRSIMASFAVVSVAATAHGQSDTPAKPQPVPAEKSPTRPETKAEGGNEYSIEQVTGNNPGPVHQKLVKLVGEWETVSKFVVPGQKPDESKGSSRITSILGGRFLSEEVRGLMMNQEFTSVKLWGYNTLSLKYESVWTYTGATSMMTMVGASKDDGKTVVYDASYETTQGSREQMTVTMKVEDDDHFAVTIAAKVPEGQQASVFETVYARKK